MPEVRNEACKGEGSVETNVKWKDEKHLYREEQFIKEGGGGVVLSTEKAVVVVVVA